MLYLFIYYTIRHAKNAVQHVISTPFRAKDYGKYDILSHFQRHDLDGFRKISENKKETPEKAFLFIFYSSIWWSVTVTISGKLLMRSGRILLPKPRLITMVEPSRSCIPSYSFGKNSMSGEIKPPLPGMMI